MALLEDYQNEVCDSCGEQLEASQIGLCDDCQEPKPILARFFIYPYDPDNDPVYVTLKDGESKSFEHSGPTDEGWFSHGETYALNDGVVTMTVGCDGMDCDGRLSSSNSWTCPIADLQSRAGWRNGGQDPTAPKMPSWEPESSSRRDYQAEAAGY